MPCQLPNIMIDIKYKVIAYMAAVYEATDIICHMSRIRT